MRALKYHGGVDVKEASKENLAALEKGLANLERHVDNVSKVYGRCEAVLWFHKRAAPPQFGDVL